MLPPPCFILNVNVLRMISSAGFPPNSQTYSFPHLQKKRKKKKNPNHELNASAICKNGLRRLYFLRRPNTFNMDKTLVVLFYKSFIESVLTFRLISWSGNLTVQNRNRRSNIVKVARKIIGIQQLPPIHIYERQGLRKGQSILAIHFWRSLFFFLLGGDTGTPRSKATD